MTTELKDLLTRAADDVTDRDFVHDALEGARTSRRRRRWSGAGAAAALAAAVCAVAVLPGQLEGSDDTLPASSPRPSASQQWKTHVVVDGLPMAFGPTAEQADALPMVDARTAKTLALPRDFNVPQRDRVSMSAEQAGLVASGDNRAPVSAVMLVNGAKGSFVPVLYRPALSRPWQTVDRTLVLMTDEDGNEWISLSDFSISPDGLSVAFLQTGQLLLLDVATAEITEINLAEPVSDVGWATDGKSLILTSEAGKAWRVSPEAGPTPIAVPASAGRSKVVADGDGTSRLQSFADDGALVATRELPRMVYGSWGSAMTGPDGHVASGMWLNSTLGLPLPTYDGSTPFQGLFTADPRDLASTRVLLAPDSPTGNQFSKGCCRVLRWVDADRVLVQWGSDILVWNTQTQDLERVSKVPRASTGAGDYGPEGSTTSSFTVAR